jgi:5-methylcytosine-specific restriction protein A
MLRNRRRSVRTDGSRYLEPHHTTPLSDRGRDDPRDVAAICLACQRRIHYGQDGPELNGTLISHLAEIERH